MAVNMFAGIDLAAEASRTGLALISELGGRLVLERLQVGADDASIIDTIAISERAGVDVPFGWPDQFVELITAHSAQELHPPQSTDRKWRRGKAMRVTDVAVHEQTGIWPLSVATERIADAAMRWTGIEASLREKGMRVARDGSGALIEVYPAAALKQWSLQHRGYKGTNNSTSRFEIVAALSERAVDLDWNGHRDQSIADDNALDAVLAALIAYEVFNGRCVPPPNELLPVVEREGWIWVPKS